MCVSQANGTNAPDTTRRWDPGVNRLLCLVKILYRDCFGDFLLVIGWLITCYQLLVGPCVTCYTFQPINYNAVANLFRVHCVGWWWLTCLYPICGFDIYIGAIILASSCVCNWVWSTWGHHLKGSFTFFKRNGFFLKNQKMESEHADCSIHNTRACLCLSNVQCWVIESPFHVVLVVNIKPVP